MAWASLSLHCVVPILKLYLYLHLAQSLTGLNNEAVIVSQSENIVVGTDSMSEMNEMDFQKVDRYIKILVDFKWGVNYRLANTTRKPLFVNAGPNW
jgi:hypothetical protein